MNPSPPSQDLLVAPAQMTVGSLDEFRLEVIAAVSRATAESSLHLSVDLRGTQVIDATGLGVLLLLHKRAREKSLKVRLLGPSPAVLEVLRNTRVHLLFEIVAPGDVAKPLGVDRATQGVASTPRATVPAPPSLDEVDPHPSVNYPGLSNPFEGASAPPPSDVVTPPIAPERSVPSEEVVEGRSPAPTDEPVPLAEPASAPSVPLRAVEPRCPDCGRVLPEGREVQFCPWCGTGERASAQLPRATLAPSVVPTPPVSTPPVSTPPVLAAPVRPARNPRLSATSATTPSAVTPSHPATTPRRAPMTTHADDFRTLLDATQLYHRIDEDGDARIIFPLESGRTQTAWITRNVDTIGEYAFRYVMSFVADAGEIAGNFALMGSLLEQVSAKKGGGLVTRGSMLLYRMPVATQASPENLAGAVALAAGIADELETAITGEA